MAGALPSSVDPRRVVDADRDGELVAVVESLLALVPHEWSDADLDNLPLEAIDVLSTIVQGRLVEVVDKVLDDLLG